MHPLFHSFKRMYWSSMRFARDWAKEYGLTPARIDMLILIDHHNGVLQRDIHEILDVVEPVVSRMLKSLEKLGYIARSFSEDDGRMKWVRLTGRGWRRLRLVVSELLYAGFTERCVRILVAPHALTKHVTAQAMRRAREFTRHQREYLQDNSTHMYPAYHSTGERSEAYPLRDDDVFRPRRGRGHPRSSRAA